MKKDYLFFVAVLMCTFVLTVTLCYAWYFRGNAEVNMEANGFESTAPGDIQIDINDQETSFDFPIIGDGLIPCSPIGSGIDGVNNDEWFVPSYLPTKIGDRCCYGFDVEVFSSASFTGTKRVAITFEAHPVDPRATQPGQQIEGDNYESDAQRRQHEANKALATNLKCAAVLLKGAEIGVDRLVAHNNYSIYDIDTNDKFNSGELTDDFYYEFRAKTVDNPAPNQKIRVMVWLDGFIPDYNVIAKGEITIKVEFLDKTPGGAGSGTNDKDVAGDFWAMYTAVRSLPVATNNKDSFDRVIEAYSYLTPEQLAVLTAGGEDGVPGVDEDNATIARNIATWRKLTAIIGKYVAVANESTVTYNYYNSIKAVTDSYSALSSDETAKLDSGIKTKLESWTAQLADLEAITVVGSADDKFMAVYYNYDGVGLTEANKADLDKLVATYAALTAVEKAKVDAFDDRIEAQINAWRTASAGYEENQTKVNVFMRDYYTPQKGKVVNNSTRDELNAVVEAYDNPSILTAEQQALLEPSVTAEVEAWRTTIEAFDGFMAKYEPKRGTKPTADNIAELRQIVSAYDELVENYYVGIISATQVLTDIGNWRRFVVNTGTINVTWDRTDAENANTNANGLTWIADMDVKDPASSEVLKLGPGGQVLESDDLLGITISANGGTAGDYKSATDPDADNRAARELGIGYMVRADVNAENFVTITVPEGFSGKITVTASPFWANSKANADANRFVALKLADNSGYTETEETPTTVDGFYIVKKSGNTTVSKQYNYEFTVSKGGTYYLSNVKHSASVNTDSSRATVFVSKIAVEGNITVAEIPEEVVTAISNYRTAVNAVKQLGAITEDNCNDANVVDTISNAVIARNAIDARYQSTAEVIAIDTEFTPINSLATNIQDFVAKVGAIGEITIATYNGKLTAIEAAEIAGAKFAEGDTAVQKTDQKLTQAREAYTTVSVSEFVRLTGDITAVENTTACKAKIDGAKEAYNLIATADRSSANVVTAKTTLDNIEQAYTFLGAYDTAVSGTNDQKKTAVNSYDALTDKSLVSDTVKAQIEEWRKLIGETPITEYTVTFNSNGGSSVATETVADGGKVAQPADPTKQGFNFGGWYSDEALTAQFDFDSAITSDTTIYAKWRATVTYSTTVGGAINAVTVDIGSEVTLAVPTQSGYRFDGWYNNAEFSGAKLGDTITVSQNITLYAKWTQIHTVTFDKNDGSVTTTQTVAHGEKVTLPDEPTRDGYTFVGWYTEADCINEFNATTTGISGDITLYAKWTVNGETPVTTINASWSYTNTESGKTWFGTTVTKFASNTTDTTNREREALASLSGVTITAIATKETGKETTMAHADLSDENTARMVKAGSQAKDFIEIVIPKGFKGTITVVASPYSNTNGTRHTALYLSESTGAAGGKNVECGGGKDCCALTNQHSYVFDFDTTAKTGNTTYYLSNVRSNHTGNKVTNDTVYVSGITVAGTTLGGGETPVTEYTVTFNSNGGSSVATQTVADGGKATRPTDPTRDGFTFDNWYANAELTTLFNFDSATITSDTTIYAKWLATVTFNVNGGSGTINAQTADEGATVKLNTTEPTRSGYRFDGWNTMSDGSGTTYLAGADFTVSQNTTLYAKWTKLHTVTFNMDGGSSVATQTVSDGGKATRPATDPTKQGFTFDNWYANAELTTLFDFDSTTITSDTIIYAKWTETGGTTTQPTAYKFDTSAEGWTGSTDKNKKAVIELVDGKTGFIIKAVPYSETATFRSPVELKNVKSISFYVHSNGGSLNYTFKIGSSTATKNASSGWSLWTIDFDTAVSGTIEISAKPSGNRTVGISEMTITYAP